jgi:hypothetical protein
MCCRKLFNDEDDILQRVQTIFLLLTGSYKILMCTLLSIVLPQKCANCSLWEHFSPTNLFPFITTIFNLATLAVFIAFYIFEYYRENWCIEYLDIDEDKPFTNLRSEIEKYPEYKEKLMYINYIYYRFSIFLCICNILNFTITGILFYKYIDYDSFDLKTISVFITYFLLIADKLISSIYYSRKSYYELTPTSSYIIAPILFNSIDNDYKNLSNLSDVSCDRKPSIYKNIEKEEYVKFMKKKTTLKNGKFNNKL